MPMNAGLGAGGGDIRRLLEMKKRLGGYGDAPPPEFDAPSAPENIGSFADEVIPQGAINIPVKQPFTYTDSPFDGSRTYKKEAPAVAPPRVGQYYGRG